MWSSILVVALVFALNPGVLGVIVLLISRPRPVQNLLAYWFGSVVVSVPLILVPLIMLHLAPASASFARDLATPSSPTARHIQIGMGILTLTIAGVMTVRALIRMARARRRHRSRGKAYAQASSRNTSTLLLDPGSDSPPPDEAPRGGPIRRLLNRARAAWENGSVWVAFVFGMTLFPGPPLALFVVTTIASSGASMATEVIAAIVFVLTMLALVEIILVSHLVAPARTQTMLRPVHNWARDHRRQVIIAILVVIGTWQVIRGMGIG
jgi:Sap, sulfolipid-1-addressing protein